MEHGLLDLERRRKARAEEHVAHHVLAGRPRDLLEQPSVQRFRALQLIEAVDRVELDGRRREPVARCLGDHVLQARVSLEHAGEDEPPHCAS